MKKLKFLTLTYCSILLLSITACEDSINLSELDRDIIGEWVVDDYILTGDNIISNNEIQDMHLIFNQFYELELSWFENGDFFVVDGTWNSNEEDTSLEINLDEDVYFFCNNDDIIFNIFFFAFDMELDTACSNDNDWMEIQLERL